MYGGVAQGIGGALYERMAYDEDGQLLNASFMDFLMPYATELPEPALLPHRDAVAQQRARRQGRGGGRDDPGRRRDRQRDLRRDRDSRSTRCRSPRRSCSSSCTPRDPHRDRHRWDVHRRRRGRRRRPRGQRPRCRRRRATRRSRSCAAIEKAGTDAIAEVIHGTTVATNALLEDDFSGLGFITTEGLPRRARDRPPERARQLRQLVLLGQAGPHRAAAPRAGGRRAARSHRRGGPRVRRGRARATSPAGSASRASTASASASCTRT